jgi:hypothetical protein
MSGAHVPWYASYDRLAREVKSTREAFDERCQQLGQRAQQILTSFDRDLLARTVHESNWQEGVELQRGRTRELAELVMDDLRFPEDGRLDLVALADMHRSHVVRLKRQGVTVAEIATLSLARAHWLLSWIAQELAFRQTASLAFALRGAEPKVKERLQKDIEDVPPQIARGFELLQSLQRDATPAYGPLQGPIRTAGELLGKLLDGSFEALLNPMDIRYIHTLHRISMMGVIPSNQLGALETADGACRRS